MTRRGRAVALLPAAALAAVLMTGCGAHGKSANSPSGTSPGSTSPAPAASELAHMRQLVDGADSAAARAESAAAGDN